MGEVLKSVAQECHYEPTEQQLKKIGKAFVGHRIVGAPEAAMRMLLMWLMKKSRKVMFVSSNVRDDCVSLPKSDKMLNELEEEEDNVYITSIHDRYAARPDSLDDICLAKFAVNYEPVGYNGGHNNNHEDGDNSDTEDCESGRSSSQHNDVTTLKNNLGQMRKQM